MRHYQGLLRGPCKTTSPTRGSDVWNPDNGGAGWLIALQLFTDASLSGPTARSLQNDQLNGPTARSLQNDQPNGCMERVSFRKTRSGAEFSPWSCELGDPIYVTREFDLDAAVMEAMEEESKRETAIDQDPDNALATPEKRVREITKEDYHQNQRGKRRRREMREAQREKADGAKRISKKIRERSLAVLCDHSIEDDITDTLTADANMSQPGLQELPTGFPLDMKTDSVASTAFIGKRIPRKQTDGKGLTLQEVLAQEGMQLIEWDGK
ncbi:uncharacterized protein LAESUDRAFT_765257 [Laetiporus sulphureus 93-53]|uniref:Uncharacterized protein n=1 Tax=Laetiporus sulphureus 93-53 TaxID=1314785 RepID=A0A165AUX1_9APHY|nr:uncharacterized protein LAESUDRAFT_765257 [Laetiporus sulphureus 93-53]KZS99709.1 hypothetical protein LAESUDRAFT_765257 [Laetiporus sulphureus 93-53]